MPNRYQMYVQWFEEERQRDVTCESCGLRAPEHYVAIAQFPTDLSDWDMELLMDDSTIATMSGLCEECARRMASRLVAQIKSINPRIYTGKRAQGEPA